MHTPDSSDGPAVKCPGMPPEKACLDYPDGACRRCMDKAEEK